MFLNIINENKNNISINFILENYNLILKKI